MAAKPNQLLAALLTLSCITPVYATTYTNCPANIKAEAAAQCGKAYAKSNCLVTTPLPHGTWPYGGHNYRLSGGKYICPSPSTLNNVPIFYCAGNWGLYGNAVKQPTAVNSALDFVCGGGP